MQVTIADVDGDGQLEMLLADSSGTVACVRHDGTECWSKRLEGACAMKCEIRSDFPQSLAWVDARVGKGVAARAWRLVYMAGG